MRLGCRTLIFIALGGGLQLLPCPEAAAEIIEVRVFDYEFSAAPRGEEILDPTIQVGDTIRWVWEEGYHDTTAVSGQLEYWKSETRSQYGFTFEHTFTNEGVFEYLCSQHAYEHDGQAYGMTGFITVVPEPTLGFVIVLAVGVGRRRWFR